MHFEILVEDQSGKKALELLVPKIISTEHNTYRIISYKGIGRIPSKLSSNADPSKRILLDQLPRLLNGYGRAFTDFSAVVILICDLDDKDLKVFLSELSAILDACNPKPKTKFCIAIEEGEAWFLGDIHAIKKAYPSAKEVALHNYKNDSICGTWELLADAVYSGGSHALASKGWQAIGAEKSEWAMKITPFMDIDANQSPSFCYFRDEMQKLAESY